MKRMALPEGTRLCQGEISWIIKSLIGSGGSALLYEADRIDENKVPEACILKEIYPSPENGSYVRDPESGLVTPANGHDYKRKMLLLEKLRDQLKYEQYIGSIVKDSSFLVCNCHLLPQLHLDGAAEILPGFAEMSSLKNNSKSLLVCAGELSGKYNGAIPLARSLSILKGITATLQKIHQSGFLFCDFSPSNVFLLNDSATAVFLDFGSATEKFGSGTDVGPDVPSTYGYRAPELENRFSGSRHLSESTDIFGVMAFFYELVSGEAFASADGEYEFARVYDRSSRLISWERAKQIGAENPAVLFFVNELLDAGLTNSPESRIADTHELMEGLRQIEAALSLGSDPGRALTLIWEKTNGRLSCLQQKELENSLPSQEGLCRAADRLDQDMLGAYRISEAAFRHQWLLYWKEKLETAGQIHDPLQWQQAGVSLDYCGVAVFNYRGDYENALVHYLRCEKQRDAVGPEKFLAVRLRAAEIYANVFRYKNAEALVKKNLDILYKNRRDTRKNFRALGFKPEKAAGSLEIGRTESALARYLSFQNDPDAAAHFERALEEFRDNADNRIRTQNSIFQMAVSLRDWELFDKYRKICLGEGTLEEQLTRLSERVEPDAAPEKALNFQEAFHLYALLKGIEVFFEPTAGDSWISDGGICLSSACLTGFLNRMAKEQPKVSPEGNSEKAKSRPSETGQRRGHPWELIYRHAAILLSRSEGKLTATAQKLFACSLTTGPAPVKEEEEEKSLNTIAALHRMTMVCEAKLAFEYAPKGERDTAEHRLEDCLTQLYSYLRSRKCNLISPAEWNRDKTPQARYQLIRKKFTYEYF